MPLHVVALVTGAQVLLFYRDLQLNVIGDVAGATGTEPVHKDGRQEPGRDSVQAAAQVQARGQGSQEGPPAQRGGPLPHFSVPCGLCTMYCCMK